MNLSMTLTDQQSSVCRKYNSQPFATPSSLKVGIAKNVKHKLYPINGMRIPPEGDTSGWYIWGGEMLSEAADFFVPLHIEHLNDWCPDVMPYLMLPPGWRFLIAPGYEDVWFDAALLGSSGDDVSTNSIS